MLMMMMMMMTIGLESIPQLSTTTIYCLVVGYKSKRQKSFYCLHKANGNGTEKKEKKPVWWRHHIHRPICSKTATGRMQWIVNFSVHSSPIFSHCFKPKKNKKKQKKIKRTETILIDFFFHFYSVAVSVCLCVYYCWIVRFFFFGCFPFD